MTEADQITGAKRPVTITALSNDFRALGLEPRDLVIVHSSLKSMGWVNGGAQAVIHALIEAVGADGTICMPSQSANVTDPGNWGAPPVPVDWHEVIRETMPAFDPSRTPTRDMGRIAELFRTWPGVLRSNHPATSFAALGPLAEEITARHDLRDPLGPSSPLGALYRLEAKVLLIGVGFDRCTALHLAEQKVWTDRPRIREGAPMMVDGLRKWIWFDVPPVMDSEGFLPVGESALRAGLGRVGSLGEGSGTLIPFRQLVDHAMSIWGANCANEPQPRPSRA